MNKEEKLCKCGMKMIKRSTGYVLCSYPAQYPMEWKCCGCGAVEPAETIRGKTNEQIHREEWEALNGLKPGEYEYPKRYDTNVIKFDKNVYSSFFANGDINTLTGEIKIKKDDDK